MTLQIALALYPLCLAGVALHLVLVAPPRSRGRWLVDAGAGGSIVVFAFLSGPWAFTSYYLRHAVLGVFALGVLYTYRRTTPAAMLPRGRATPRLARSATLLGLFLVLDALALASHGRPRDSVALSFPLASGTYYVLQGGNSVATNPFHSVSGTPLAFDIVRLNAFGNRANGLAPRRLADYEIFGDVVYSPCEGIVVAVQDTLADSPPGEPDREHPANHVTVRCGDVEVFMAHLMRGSAKVSAGAMVRAGEPVGRVGNSGHTLEPHLHIGAKRSGVEVGLVFDGRWLSMNSVVRASASGGRPGWR
jgi:hypothetical protein